MKIKTLLYLLCSCTICLQVNSQTYFNISPNTHFLVSTGTTVDINDLAFKPTSDFSISGPNKITKTDTTLFSDDKTHIKRVYNILNTLTNYNGNIIIYYKDSELNDLPENTLSLAVYNGAQWNNFSDKAERDSIANFVSTLGIVNQSIRELTLTTGDHILPLTWLKLEAAQKDGYVRISWIVTNELNCKSYQVLKSIDGINWKKIGVPVLAKNQTNGDYSYNDSSKFQQIIYYQILETDYNGHNLKSPVMLLRKTEAPELAAYPNPANTNLTVSIIGNSEQYIKQVSVYNTDGKLVLKSETINSTAYKFNVKHLSAGLYESIIIFNDGTIKKNAFLVIH